MFSSNLAKYISSCLVSWIIFAMTSIYADSSSPASENNGLVLSQSFERDSRKSSGIKKITADYMAKLYVDGIRTLFEFRTEAYRRKDHKQFASLKKIVEMATNEIFAGNKEIEVSGLTTNTDTLKIFATKSFLNGKFYATPIDILKYVALYPVLDSFVPYPIEGRYETIRTIRQFHVSYEGRNNECKQEILKPACDFKFAIERGFTHLSQYSAKDGQVEEDSFIDDMATIFSQLTIIIKQDLDTQAEKIKPTSLSDIAKMGMTKGSLVEFCQLTHTQLRDKVRRGIAFNQTALLGLGRTIVQMVKESQVGGKISDDQAVELHQQALDYYQANLPPVDLSTLENMDLPISERIGFGTQAMRDFFNLSGEDAKKVCSPNNLFVKEAFKIERELNFIEHHDQYQAGVNSQLPGDLANMHNLPLLSGSTSSSEKDAEARSNCNEEF